MRLASMTSSRKTVGGGPPPDYKDLDFLGALVAAGKIKTVIDRQYSMEQIVDTHRYIDTERKRGNVVVRIEPAMHSDGRSPASAEQKAIDETLPQPVAMPEGG